MRLQLHGTRQTHIAFYCVLLPSVAFYCLLLPSIAFCCLLLLSVAVFIFEIEALMSRICSLTSHETDYLKPVWCAYRLKGGTLLVAQLVEALLYKPEGRGFDFRWCHWNFLLT